DEIAFLQIARITDLTTKKPHEKLLPAMASYRMTSDGWVLDRQPHTFGWFGYDDSGQPDFPTGRDEAGVKPGSCPANYQPPIMKDAPGHPQGVANAKFEFETYAIARSGKDEGTIYGGISWGFEIDKDRKITPGEPAFLKGPTSEFNLAVGLWDSQ